MRKLLLALLLAALPLLSFAQVCPDGYTCTDISGTNHGTVDANRVFFTKSATGGTYGYTLGSSVKAWFDTLYLGMAHEADTTSVHGQSDMANPAFNSVHASGGNLAAANAQVVKKWITGLDYVVDVTAVVHGGSLYVCTSSHTAGATTEPGVGASWETVWAVVTGAGDDLGSAAAADIVALFNSGTCSGYLKSDGSCDTPSDVTDVADCTGGACLDGSSDGGTRIRLYDGNSHYTQLSSGDSSADLTFTFPTAYPGATSFLKLGTAGAMSTGSIATTDLPTTGTLNWAGVTLTLSSSIDYPADTVKDADVDWGSGAGKVDLDDVPDGTSYQRVAATDVDGNAHVNLVQDSDGTGAVQFTGTTDTRAITVPDAAATMSYKVAGGTSALGTSEIASGACATAVTTTATGTATTDVINWGFNGDPTSTTGYSATANGMLTIIAYPSANNVNFKVCNNTAGAITPGAVTLNWLVLR